MAMSSPSDHICNATPRPVIISLPNGDEMVVPPSGEIVRLEMEEREIWDYPVRQVVRGPTAESLEQAIITVRRLSDFPLVIVPATVLDAMPADEPMLAIMAAPDGGPTAIRKYGRVLAVRRLRVRLTLPQTPALPNHTGCRCPDWDATLHGGAAPCPWFGGPAAFCVNCQGCKFCRLMREEPDLAKAHSPIATRWL